MKIRATETAITGTPPEADRHLGAPVPTEAMTGVTERMYRIVETGDSKSARIEEIGAHGSIQGLSESTGETRETHLPLKITQTVPHSRTLS